MDKLTELISNGPDRRYRMKAVVLDRYDDIVQARALMHTWSDIAAALGFDGRGKDISGCFARVDKGIKNGKLKQPSKTQAASTTQPAIRNNGIAKSKSGIIDLDDPANQ